MSAWMQKPLVALVLLALGMSIIPLNDALIKLMSANLPLAEIVVVRGILALILVGIFSNGIKRMLGLSARVFWLFFGRAMCLVVAMALFFIPLGSLPLSTVVSIFFVAPLLITLLSIPFLGERIGFHRILSVCMGMAGVLLIIRPGSDQFQIETLVVFGAALSYAIFQIWTRRLKAVGDLSAMVATQHLCYVVAALPFLVMNYLAPRPASDNVTLDFMLRAPAALTTDEMMYVAFCAAAVLLLSYVSSNAYRSVEASLIAPFEYVAIPSATIWGIIIWQEWPDVMAWAGMGLILGGGLYTVYRERTQQVEVMSSAPMPGSASAAQYGDEGFKTDVSTDDPPRSSR